MSSSRAKWLNYAPLLLASFLVCRQPDRQYLLHISLLTMDSIVSMRDTPTGTTMPKNCVKNKP
jgi:hypothetical protein